MAAGWSSPACVTSMILAFPYLRVVVMMWLSEPGEHTPTVTVPGALTSAALMVGVLATLVLGVVPGAAARPGQRGRRVRPVTGSSRGPVRRSRPAAGPCRPAPGQRRAGVACVGRRGDRGWRASGATGCGGRRGRAAGSVRRARPAPRRSRARGVRAGPAWSDVEVDAARRAWPAADPLVDRGGPAPGGGRRQAVPPAAGGAGAPSSATRRAPQVVPAAVVVELTHLATLYHDDVMDEAPVRRGAPSANARWGNSIAILVGDYLFARAADIAAELGPEAVRIQARTFARLVHGQIAETVGPRDGATRSQHYLQVIADKTGSLIGTSARFGGMFSGAPPDHVEALAGYGETIGVAFQLSDDLLDIASESARVRQDARHRPARGRADAAGALRARRRRRRRRRRCGCGRSWPPARSPTTRCTPRRWSCCASPPALKRARETVRGYAEHARAQLAAAARHPGPPRPGVALRLHRRPHQLTHRRRPPTAVGRRPGRSSGRVGQGQRAAAGEHEAGGDEHDAAATAHMRRVPEVARRGRRSASGPRQPPTYTPVWVIEVAAAGACGCSRTTAKLISPGQAQPRPKPSTTPATSGRRAGQGEQRQPDRADDQHAGDSPDVAAGPAVGQPARAHPGRHADRAAQGEGEAGQAGRQPRSTAESTRNVPSALAAAAARVAATPTTTSAAVARPARPAAAGAAGHPLPGVRRQRGQRGPGRRDERPAPADGQRDGGHRRTGQQRGDRDRGLLDAERQPLPVGRARAGPAPRCWRAGRARWRRRSTPSSATNAGYDRASAATASSEPAASRMPARATTAGPYRSTSAPEGTEASALIAEVDGDGDAQPGRGEVQVVAHLHGEAADQEDGQHARDGGGDGARAGADGPPGCGAARGRARCRSWSGKPTLPRFGSGSCRSVHGPCPVIWHPPSEQAFRIRPDFHMV